MPQWQYSLSFKYRLCLNYFAVGLRTQEFRSDSGPMDKASHLSVIVDLSPIQWHLSSLPTNEFPLSLENFLSQLLAFLNTHVASKHENTLAVFGAFPGKRFASSQKLQLNKFSLLLV